MAPYGDIRRNIDNIIIGVPKFIRRTKSKLTHTHGNDFYPSHKCISVAIAPRNVSPYRENFWRRSTVCGMRQGLAAPLYFWGKRKRSPYGWRIYPLSSFQTVGYFPHFSQPAAQLMSRRTRCARARQTWASPGLRRFEFRKWSWQFTSFRNATPRMAP